VPRGSVHQVFEHLPHDRRKLPLAVV
jgi:hypothetical protein